MTRVMPIDWMPNVSMERIHLHWTGGGPKANKTDRAAYHILIEADGNLIRGDVSISKNAYPRAKIYAKHTLGANTNAIGVSLCCMSGVNKEQDYLNTTAPMTTTQWEKSFLVLADLADKYNIPVTPKTILTHAEVETNLGVLQNGKWDITRLSFNSKLQGFRAIGQEIRSKVAALISSDAPSGIDNLAGSTRLPKYRVSGVYPNDLIFRRAPGGDKIGSLPERTVVERLGIDGEWWRVRTRLGYAGYVYHSFLTPVNV